MKRTIISVLSLVLALTLILTGVPAASAASSHNKVLSVAVAFDSNGDQSFYTYGVVGTYKGEAYVYSDSFLATSSVGAAYYMVGTDNGDYNMEYDGDLGDGSGCIRFSLDEANDNDFIPMVGPKEDTQCYFHYIDSDGDEAVTKAIITGYEEEDNFYELSVQLGSCDVKQYDDGTYFFGALISQKGELLGYLTPNGMFITQVISANFYG